MMMWHFLLHIPSSVLQCGPLDHISCIFNETSGEAYAVRVYVSGTKRLPALDLTWLPVVILTLSLHCSSKLLPSCTSVG